MADPDLQSHLFTGKKRNKKEEKNQQETTARENRTPLPLAAGHHGRRRREGERPAVGFGKRFKEEEFHGGSLHRGRWL
jgi:hypothetical protein